jgi:hypothetical protein
MDLRALSLSRVQGNFGLASAARCRAAEIISSISSTIRQPAIRSTRTIVEWRSRKLRSILCVANLPGE